MCHAPLPAPASSRSFKNPSISEGDSGNRSGPGLFGGGIFERWVVRRPAGGRQDERVRPTSGDVRSARAVRPSTEASIPQRDYGGSVPVLDLVQFLAFDRMVYG